MPSNASLPSRRPVLLDQIATPYNHLEVWRRGDRIDFEVADALHATWHPTCLLTGMAWDAITAGCLLADSQPPRSLLMLGLGGGTALRQVRQLLPALKITTVEIDPEIIRLAQTHMNVGDLDLEIVEGDAYAFLENTTRQWDVIVDDVYRAGALDVMRPRGYDAPMLELIASRLSNKQGTFVINLVTGRGHRTVQSATRRAIAAHFSSVRTVRPPESSNEIIVAGNTLAAPALARNAESAFPLAADRAYWRRLSYRRLPTLSTNTLPR